MSLKTLIFGQNELIKKMLTHINPNIDSGQQQSIHVQNAIINQKDFMLFAINDRTIIKQQAVGSNALMFFLDHQKPLYEEKQFLVDILHSKRQFENIPLVVLFEKQQGFHIKDIINYLELFKMKDRTSMIKQISFSQAESIVDAFQWIQNQSQFRKSRTTFDAMPKVVKMKPKYRQSQQDQSVKKYQTILKDKQIRTKNVKDQQQTYITQEKERIKNQNMEKQLANFNKNKKKMTPYDIKATPNPKIQANLHFFLKDPKNQKQAQVNIKIQTDEFKPRPPEKPYVPKKTGINISTQIEQNQLFNFDKQVKPILNILVIKALQTAALQIQQQEQFSKIQKYKAAYNDRVKRQKEHQNKKIDDQLALIKKKQKLLQEARKKHESKKNIKKRIICYDVSNRFLQDIYKKSNLNLFNKNQYFDPYENQIKTNYLQHLVQKTADQLHKLQQKQDLIKGVFQQDCIEPILKLAQKPRYQRQLLKKQFQKRRINQSQNERVVYILYKNPEQTYSSFSKYIDKYFDSTLQDFIRSKQEQYQDISDKISSGDLPDDQLNKAKNNQNQKFGMSHQSFTVDSQNDICFTITPNRYEKNNQNLFNMGFLALDKQGEVITYDFIDKNQEEKYNYLKHLKNLRSTKNIVNMDQGINISLKNIPVNVKSIILLTRFNNVAKYMDQQFNKKVKYASYGLQLYQNNVSLHKQNISEKINWAQLIKAPQTTQQNQNNQQENLQSLICVSYILQRKNNQKWNIEHTRYVSKPTVDIKKFIQDMTHFYSKSLEIFKQEQQQDLIVSQKKAESKKQKRGAKSKKALEQPQKPKIPPKLYSKVFSKMAINLNSDLIQITEQLQNQVKKWRQFIETCQAGFEILMKGKKIQSIDQIKKFKKIGDLQVIKLKPIIQEEKTERTEIVEENQNEEN